MYERISEFQMKFGLWKQQLKTKKLFFLSYIVIAITQEEADKYASLTSNLNLEFENRFQEFKKHHVLF